MSSLLACDAKHGFLKDVVGTVEIDYNLDMDVICAELEQKRRDELTIM